MALYDKATKVAPVSTLAPQAVTAAVNGATVDLQNFEAATVVFNLGAFTGTTPTATLDIQDSPDGAVWTSVVAANLIGGALPAAAAVIPANTPALVKRGYIGIQRYLRACVTAVSGTTPSLLLSAHVTREMPRTLPTAASAL